ncbi:MAG: Isochorismatase hydrolase [Thermoleophilia bacterium]|jgi:nicotinamidase-related amidase|nr:Isochorismatase hydrolase [Thermoleophilia bacterium]
MATNLTNPHPHLLDRTRSALVVVDVQEAFRAHMPGFDEMVRGVQLLVEGAQLLGVPVAYAEQYPKGLGHTVPELLELLGDAPSIEKTEFSVAAAPGWADLPAAVRDAEQFVVVGIEGHVCVRQTALDLLAAGRDVHLPVDAIASQGALNSGVALDALRSAGAHLATAEQVLFDWLGHAKAPGFKEIQALLKRRAAVSAGATVAAG